MGEHQDPGWSGTDAELTEDALVTITSGRVGDAIVVSVAGELDAFTAGRLREVVTRALDEPGPGLVVVDLTGVGFLASSGMGALIDAHNRAVQRREPLRVVVDHNRPVTRALVVSGIDEALTLYRDVAAALAARPGDDGVEIR